MPYASVMITEWICQQGRAVLWIFLGIYLNELFLTTHDAKGTKKA